MSAALEPGMWVECLRSGSGRLRVGGLYCVRTVVVEDLPCPCHGESPFGVTLRGIVQTDGAVAFCGLNFRPLYSPKSETFRHLLQPAPERERENA